MGITEPLTALLAAIPGLAKIGADMAASSDEAKRNAQLIEFQKVLIKAHSDIAAVQVQNASLLRNKHDLEQQVVRMKTWESQKQRYKLDRPWDGATVYALKESMKDSDPPHWICPQCYESGKRSILQYSPGNSGFSDYACPCGAVIHSRHRGVFQVEYAPD